MENQKDDILLKDRSSRACIGAGYRLFTSNFKKIFRYTWFTAVIYGIVNGIYTSYMVTEYPKMFLAMTTGQLFASENAGHTALMSLVTLLMLLSTIWLYSHMSSLLYQHRTEGVITVSARLFQINIDKHAILRVIAWSLVSIVLMFILSALIGGVAYFAISKQSLTLMGFTGLLGLIILLLMIPLCYPAMHYLTTRDTKLFKILGSDYVTGFRHWGMLFTVAFVTVIFSSIILTLTTLPAVILSIANIKAQMGVVMGDPLGMPDYIGKLTLLVFSLAGFIQAYVILSIFFPAYYASGSIETQEQERHEKKDSLY
jgi:hypothetical protein